MQFMMGSCPRCYILSFMQIGPAVPEKKIFEGFLPYMGMVAILVMWPGSHMQTFVPPSHGGATWNLTSIGPVVQEEKVFENVNTRHTDKQPCHMISSPMSLRLRWAKKSYCISANTMQLLPVLPQQLGNKFDHAVKRSTVIQISSFEQT